MSNIETAVKNTVDLFAIVQRKPPSDYQCF